MNLALWIVASVLAVVFLASGGMKLVRSKPDLEAGGMAALDTYSANQVKLIGAAEVLGALGLILPAVLHVAPVLVPIAAVCLALVMIGAAATHARRREASGVAMTIVLALLAAFVAWGRFGAYAS